MLNSSSFRQPLYRLVIRFYKLSYDYIQMKVKSNCISVFITLQAISKLFRIKVNRRPEKNQPAGNNE